MTQVLRNGRGWLRRGLAFSAVLILWNVHLAEGAQSRAAPQPTSDQAVILCRESEARIVFRDTHLPIEWGYNGGNLWALVPAAPIVIGIDLVFLGSGNAIAGLPVPLAGGTTYRLVVDRHEIGEPFGTHYIWFENADTGARVSYRFAILPSRRG